MKLIIASLEDLRWRFPRLSIRTEHPSIDRHIEEPDNNVMNGSRGKRRLAVVAPIPRPRYHKRYPIAPIATHFSSMEAQETNG
jgi:hypothetical protein